MNKKMTKFNKSIETIRGFMVAGKAFTRADLQKRVQSKEEAKRAIRHLRSLNVLVVGRTKQGLRGRPANVYMTKSLKRKLGL